MLNPIIAQKLPKELHTIAENLNIAVEIFEKNQELIELLLKSKSIDKIDEKQNWLNLMPMMTEEQILKLKDILVREKQKLDEIEKKYEDKKTEIKRKYLLRRQNMWYIKKVNEIKAQEKANNEKELVEADQLLQNI